MNHRKYRCIRLLILMLLLQISLEEEVNNEEKEKASPTVENQTESGGHVGARCDKSCSNKLQNVYCNLKNAMCQCDRNFPVKLNPYIGCGKPQRLGDQCFYKETCQYTDQFSSCIQIHNNAVCQCTEGYHLVSIQKPSSKMFCSKDIVIISSDFSAFIGVLAGIAVLTGLLCFTLHLFNQNLYGNHHHSRFGNTNLIPTTLFTTDLDEFPMRLNEHSLTSRTSSRRSYTYQYPKSHSSQGSHGSARTAAVLLLSYRVPSDEVICNSNNKIGSRRPSYSSVHSTASLGSYSARRYEREREQKEEKEMQRRLSKIKSTSKESNINIRSPDNTVNDKEVYVSHFAEEESISLHDIPSTSNQVF